MGAIGPVQDHALHIEAPALLIGGDMQRAFPLLLPASATT